MVVAVKDASPNSNAVMPRRCSTVSCDDRYDKNGNLTSIIQPLGQETTRVFDPLNRLKQIIEEIPVSGASHPTTTFTYDGADNNRSAPAAECPLTLH